jgi:hypothetical protein
MSETLRIFGKRAPIKYSSVQTRFSSLHGFQGGAEFNEVNSAPDAQPGEIPEDLEARFNSGVNRTDCPRMWGHPQVVRKLANKYLDNEAEIQAWRRDGGERLDERSKE